LSSFLLAAATYWFERGHIRRGFCSTRHIRWLVFQLAL